MSGTSDRKAQQERPIGGSGKYLFCGKSETGYVGLFNQGATCYLNSLLQSLYMTPQFRKAIFEISFDEQKDGDPTYHIPYQLQLLFARMALSRQPAVNTKGLTTSFHWDRAQSFEQNDVQELMKVLLEALEKTLALDPKNSFTTNLYMGSSVDYLKSLAGDGFERQIDSKFDQFALALDDDVNSVKDGIVKFLKPDKLMGDNQWRHPKTGQKVDAEKGIYLKELPSVLTVTLKRFRINFQLMTREKVNKKVVVDETIDMNAYMPEEYKKTGGKPWNYDLFAIMMHSGTARGGHYYAFIKSWTDGKWYSFNDAVVRELEVKHGEDVLKLAHGNGKAGTSAYMLMYMDRERTPKTLADAKAQIPEHIQKVIDAEDLEWETERKEYERLRRLICMTVYFDNKEIKIEMDRGVTVEQLTKGVIAKAELKDTPADCVRLRRYDPSIGWAQGALEGNNTLEGCKFPRQTSLIMETRAPGADWPEINPNAVPVRVVKVAEDNIQPILQSLAYSNQAGGEVTTLMVDKMLPYADLKAEIARLLDMKADTMQLIKLDSQKSEQLDVSATGLASREVQANLTTLNVAPGAILYAEAVGAASADDEEPQGSALVKAFEQTVGQITVEFNVPESKDDSKNMFVTVSKNKTLKQLKAKMLPLLGLEDVEDFRLKRSATAEQWKDEDQTLDELQFMSAQYVFVERGRPLRKGECNLRFYYYDNDEDTKSAFKYLFTIPVMTNIEQPELHKNLLKYLKDLKPDGKGGNSFGIQHMRIREKLSKGAGAIFQSNLALNRGLKKFKKFRDGDSLAIQKITEPEVVNKTKNHLIFIHQFERDTDRLHRARELVVSRMTTVGDLIPKLVKTARDDNMAEITSTDNIGLAAGKLTSKTTVNDCVCMKWKAAGQLNPKARISMALKVRSEGTLIFTDLTTAQKSKPPEKKAKGRSGRGRSPGRFKKQFGGGANKPGVTVVGGPRRPYRPEKALKIWTTAEKKEAEAKKAKEQAEKKKAKEAQSEERNKTQDAEGQTGAGKKGGVVVDIN